LLEVGSRTIRVHRSRTCRLPSRLKQRNSWAVADSPLVRKSLKENLWSIEVASRWR
jgi:hypothetical protein